MWSPGFARETPQTRLDDPGLVRAMESWMTAMPVGISTYPPRVGGIGSFAFDLRINPSGQPGTDRYRLRYSAGVMLLANEHLRVIRYRSAEPVLADDRIGVARLDIPDFLLPAAVADPPPVTRTGGPSS
jgi:hypothetical protein